MLNLDRRRGQEGNHLGAATVGTPVLELEWRNLILGDWPCGTKSLHNEYWLKHIWKDWDPEDWVTSKHPAFITLPNTYWMFKITCKMRKFYLIQEVMGEQRLSKLDKYIVLFPPIGLIFKNCVLLMFFCVFLPPLLNIFCFCQPTVFSATEFTVLKCKALPYLHVSVVPSRCPHELISLSLASFFKVTHTHWGSCYTCWDTVPWFQALLRHQLLHSSPYPLLLNIYYMHKTEKERDGLCLWHVQPGVGRQIC